MIVRILGDAQYRLDDEAFASANEIDDRVQAAVDAEDPEAFGIALAELIGLVQQKGEELGIDEFIGSDAIIPDADTSLEEAQQLLGDEGLVPDSK